MEKIMEAISAPVCVNVCLGQSVPLSPAGLSFLLEGVGEKKLSGCAESYENHPCQPLSVRETREQVVSSVVQVLMFWGHGCERSDLAPRSPTYTPGKPETKTAAKASAPNSPLFICWDGV